MKNINQIENLPQIGMKIKHIWNHHLAYYCYIRFSLIFFQGMMVVQSIISEAVVTPHLWSLGESIRIIWVCPLMTRMKTQHGPLAQPLQKSTHIQLRVSNEQKIWFPFQGRKAWMCFLLDWFSIQIFESHNQFIRPTPRISPETAPIGAHCRISAIFVTCKLFGDPCRFQHEFLNLEDVQVNFVLQKLVPIHDRWWLNQPSWKICSSTWTSSPNRGEHENIFENIT